MKTGRIKTRLVLHFPGYEPVSAEHHYQRFVREAVRFQKLWGVSQKTGALEEDGGVSCWHTQSRGADWTVSTRVILMEWASHPGSSQTPAFWRRIAVSAPRYLAHYLTLSPWRYFKANWRYGLFFIYPVLVTLLLATVALVAVWGIRLQGSGEMPGFVAGIAGLAVFVVIFRIFAQRWRVPLELDLLSHTHSVALGQNDAALGRIATFSGVLEQELKNCTADEITISAHSFGSVYAVAALARVLRDNPGALGDTRLTFIAIGSNLLQIGLMSRCGWVREDLRLVLGHGNIQWIEIYAADDPICFYKSGPDTVIDEPPANELISKRVRFSRMIEKNRYKPMRGRFFRLHRQLIMANECPYFYDFYLLLFGPRPAVETLQRKPVTQV